MTECARGVMECLYIEDFTSGAKSDSGLFCPLELPDVRLYPVPFSDGVDFWERLQVALQELRAARTVTGVVARGTGCAAALALAAQLPVDRLVLMEPVLYAGDRRVGGQCAGMTALSARSRRRARRIADFARRNLALCVSDILIVERRRAAVTDALCRGLSAHSRVFRLCIGDENDEKLYKYRENTVKQAISRFLQCAEAPKPLAENPEMCIIYG